MVAESWPPVESLGRRVNPKKDEDISQHARDLLPACVSFVDVAERLSNLAWDVKAKRVAFTWLHGNVEVTGSLAVDGSGRLVVQRIAVEAGDGGVTTDVLRSVPLGRIVAQISGDLGKTLSPALDRKELARFRAVAAELQPPRRGRPSKPPEHYRRIAELYLALQSEGFDRGILDEIARRESTRNKPVARDTARDWVRKATVLEYLSPGVVGRAGRQPGPRLIAEQHRTTNRPKGRRE